MGSQGGSCIIRESEVGWMVVVGDVRRVVRRDWVPSRAMAFRVSFLWVEDWERRDFVGGRGFGSVVVRWERS